MGKFIDLTGQKFGRLTVIKRIENNNRREARWLCKCDCGGETETTSAHLNSGHTKSCGCLSKENSGRHTKHGLSQTRLYKTYTHMKERCYIKSNKSYKNYGNKGIKICDEWLDKENGLNSFYNWSMQNGYRDDLTIDRIDSEGDYTPSNCRWVDRYVQNNNTSRNHHITYNNETHTLAQWEKILKINQHTLLERIRNKVPKELLFYKGKITPKIRKECEDEKNK